jgi:hypothetical protein
MTSRFETQCHAEGIDRAIEESSQRMPEWRVSQVIHEVVSGTGRRCCVTARAYCR